MSDYKALGCICIVYVLALTALWISTFSYASKWGLDAINLQEYSFSVVN